MERYKETKLSYDQHAEWHVQKSNRYSWNKQIDRFVRELHGRRILDVGCGGGRDIAEFLRRGLKADGLDYSAETIRLCQQKFPDAAFFVGDMRDIGNIKELTNLSNKSLPMGRYDGVWACASILHIKKSEVPDVLSGIKSVLKEHGKLFVSVKKGKGERIVYDSKGKRFFSFYLPNEIKKLFEQSGFKVNYSENISDAELTGKASKPAKPDWICLYAKKS
ncbi:class I SAM-dependent methyltransferase [Candidatus Woesearchaeota archaeon]|nr:class I SAM-dependent methyltransferase [Candidatus Woesearchaeota archaeon]